MVGVPEEFLSGWRLSSLVMRQACELNQQLSVVTVLVASSSCASPTEVGRDVDPSRWIHLPIQVSGHHHQYCDDRPSLQVAPIELPISFQRRRMLLDRSLDHRGRIVQM